MSYPAVYLLSLFLLVTRPSIASDTVINFDDLRPGVPVATQYAAKGLRFINHFKESTPSFPTVMAIAMTSSKPNAASLKRTPCSGEFCESYAVGEFHAGPRNFVSVTFINYKDSGTDTEPVKLEIFSADQSSMGTKSARLKPGGRTTIRLNDAVGSSRIAYFAVSSSGFGRHIAIDDVTFNSETGPVVSDFSLSWPGGLAVSLRPGGTAVTKLTLHRFGSSLTPISLSTGSGLPAGVSVTYSPNPTMAPDASTITATFSATSSAPAGGATVTVVGKPPSGSPVRTVDLGLFVRDTFDMRIVGVEVTQGTQPMDLPRVSADPSLPVSYLGGTNDEFGRPLDDRGVPLAEAGKTVVRVFANLRLAPKVTTVGPIQATLQVCDNDGKKCTAEQKSELGPRALIPGQNFVTRSTSALGQGVRALEDSAYTFTLPPETTRGTISVKARLYGPEGLPLELEECKEKLCIDNNTFTLKDITFVKTRELFVWPVELIVNAEKAPSSRFAFADAINLTPAAAGDVHVPEYNGAIDISDIQKIDTIFSIAVDSTMRAGMTTGRLIDRADDWNLYDDSLDNYMVVGVFPDKWGSRIRSLFTSRDDCNFLGFGCNTHKAAAAQGPNPGSAIPNRPITSLAHEFFHYLGRPHASNACGATGGESWPPDEQGFLQSIGLDRRGGVWRSLLAKGPYRVIPHASPSLLKFDLMSYCGTIGSGDPTHWLSVRNWRAVIGSMGTTFMVSLGGATTASDDTAPTARADALADAEEKARWREARRGPADHIIVRAFVNTDGRILLTKVAPFPQMDFDPHGTSISPLTLQGRDAGGALIASAKLTQWSGHAEGGGNIKTLVGVLPAGAVNKIEIVKGEQILARRARPNGSLQVALVEPNANTSLGNLPNGSLTVKWRSGGTSSSDSSVIPIAKIDYSATGKEPWRPIFTGQDTGSALVPLAHLPRSGSCGRLRIRVNDGFNEADAVSDCLAFPGSVADVRILNPAPASVFSEGSRVVLQGEAFDDRGRPITADGLDWILPGGNHSTGRQSILDVDTLPIGRISRAALRAKDYVGRISQRFVSFRCTREQTPTGNRKRCEVICEATPFRDSACELVHRQ